MDKENPSFGWFLFRLYLTSLFSAIFTLRFLSKLNEDGRVRRQTFFGMALTFFNPDKSFSQNNIMKVTIHVFCIENENRTKY